MRNWLFILVLFFPSFSFAQEFQSVVGGRAFYPTSSGSFIPPDGNYAVLEVKFEPRGTNNIVSVAILPRLYMSDVQPFQIHALGWHTFSGVSESEGSYGILYSVISADTIYTWSSAYPTLYLNQIQTILSSMGLGTVEQRAAYIASFKLHVGPLVDPSSILGDLQKLLGPWAAIAIGFMIALFGLDLGTRYMDRFAKQAAKEARAADRRERNAEIRSDPVAKQFRAHMSQLAMVSRNTYGIYSRTEQREARKLFEQAASDYATYKKNRGWYA